MILSVFSTGYSADAGQKMAGNGALPCGSGMQIGKPDPVAADAAGIQAVRGKFFQNHGVLGLIRPVAQHGAHLVRTAAVIPLPVPEVGAGKRICSDIDRAFMAARPRDLDHDDPVAAAFHDLYILFGKDVRAHLCTVVYHLPEFGDQPFGRGQRDRNETLVRSFDHAQKENAAEGIGKGGIGLPDTVGKASLCFFRFDPVVFPIDFQIGKIQHNIRLSFSRLIPAPSCTGKGTVRNAF